MRFPLPALAVASALMTLAPSASAGNWFVKEGSINGDGLSWATAFGSLEEAFAVVGPGDKILVHEGTYLPRNAGTGRNRTYDVPGDLELHGGFKTSTNPDLPDGSFFKTVLSGNLDNPNLNTDNAYHVVTLDGNGGGLTNRVIIDGFRITEGMADGTGPNEGEGGGIRCFDSELKLEYVILRDNFETRGGGLHFDGNSAAVLEWRKTRVRDNLAADEGGGCFIKDADDCAIVNVRFRDCGGSVERGGGIYVGSNVKDLEVTQCLFHDNSAGTGGAMYIADATNSGSGGSVWTNNTVAFNSASTMAGAGMYIEGQSPGVLVPEVYNSIHYFNPVVGNDQNITLAAGAGVIVQYSDIGIPGPGAWPGSGNIDADPLFRNASARNLRLTSLAPNFSPCLDRGDDCRVPSDRLDLDDDTNFIEVLPWDFDLLNDPDTMQASVRFADVQGAPDLGFDCVSLPNDPAGVIVDMGAYESESPGDDPPDG